MREHNDVARHLRKRANEKLLEENNKNRAHPRKYPVKLRYNFPPSPCLCSLCTCTLHTHTHTHTQLRRFVNSASRQQRNQPTHAHQFISRNEAHKRVKEEKMLPHMKRAPLFANENREEEDDGVCVYLFTTFF